MIGLERHSTTIDHAKPYHGLSFEPTVRPQCSREANIHPAQPKYLSRGNCCRATVRDTQADVPLA